ncbi:MAG: DNA-binding protein [Subdoligranulum sp.]
MLEYISAPEAAKKWGISERRFKSCAKKNAWCCKIQPYVVDTKDAEKPVDGRRKSLVDKEE